MHLALVCFFFEADAVKLGQEAGREARNLYRAKHAPHKQCCLSLGERLEETLLRIRELVDPITIQRVVYALENRVYGAAHRRSKAHAIASGKSKAQRFSIVEFHGYFFVLNVLVFLLLS